MPTGSTLLRLLAIAVLPAVWAGCSPGDASRSGDSGARAAEAATALEAADARLEPTAEAWSVLERSSPEGDGREVVLARNASTGRNSWGVSPTLYLSCESGRTRLSIAWHEDPEGSDNDVTTRIDEGREVRRTWRNETDESSVFPGDSTVHFVRELMEADSLTVRTDLYKRMPVTVVFRLDGLAEEIEPLREACGW